MHEKRFHGDVGRLRTPERVERLTVARVVELVTGKLSVGSVLDVGTGSGLFAERFALAGAKVTGVDADPAMVKIAAGYVPGGSFVQSVAESLPFDDNSFDVVFSGLVLHETDDPLKAVAEAARTARLRVAVLEWPFREEEHGPPAAHRLERSQITGWFQTAGLRNISVHELDHTVLYIGDV